MVDAEAGPSVPTTTSMLSEIGVGTAAELVVGVRYATSPPGPTFIPELDNLLLSARPHAGGSSLRRSDLIEVIGPSGSGKTSLAVFILMTALLPAALELPLQDPLHVTLGGRGSNAAVILPPTHSNAVPALEKAMRAHIATQIDSALREGNIPVQAIQSAEVLQAIRAAINSSLDRLHVLRPKPRALGWVQAIRRLLSSNHQPQVVVCDGFGDGYWPERWQEETKRAPAGNANMRDVWEALTALRSETGTVVIVTVQGLRPDDSFFKTHLAVPYPSPFERPEPSPWPLNIQLTLTGPSRPLQFPAETTLVEALQARNIGGMQVCNAVVRVPGGQGVVGSQTGARWSFGITEDGFTPFT